MYAKNLHTVEYDEMSAEKHSKDEFINHIENSERISSGCPNFLIEKINKDAHSNMRDWNLKKEGTYDDFCAAPVQNLAVNPNEGDLSQRLSSHELTKLGGNKENFSDKCLKYIKDPKKKKFLIAEYYSNMARLKMGTLSSLESLQAIDSVLGETSLFNESCSSMGHAMVRSGCEKLKECKPNGGLEAQVKELENIYPEYVKLKNDISSLESKNISSGLVAGPGGIPDASQIEKNAQRNDLVLKKQKEMEFLETLYPTLKGKVFHKTFDPVKKNFKEALVNQLKETRKKISSEIKELQSATDCMNGQLIMCDRFDQTLSKTPPLDVKAFKGADRLSYEDAQVQTYLNAVECFHKVRKAGDTQSESIKSFLTNSALVVATLGAGSFAAYGRLAFLNAQEAKLAYGLKSLPEAVGKTKVLSKAALGFDVFTLGKGGADAYQKCSKDLNQLSRHGFNKNKSDHQIECAQNPSQSSQAQIIADYRACVLHTVLAGASSLVLPKGIKKAVEGPFKGITKAGKALKDVGNSDFKEDSKEDSEEYSE